MSTLRRMEFYGKDDVMNKEESREFTIELFERLGRLLTNGAPLVSAMRVLMKERFTEGKASELMNFMTDSIEYGRTFSEAAGAVGMFPDELLTLLANAEEKGRLDEVLSSVTDCIRSGDFAVGLPLKTAKIAEKAISDESEKAPDLVEEIIRKAFGAGATDLHIEPDGAGAAIRYRIDGRLHPRPERVKAGILRAVVSRIKIMSGMDAAEKKLPQSGKITVSRSELGGMDKEKGKMHLSVSICPFFHGEKVVIRFLDQNVFPDRLEKIGLTGDKLKSAKNFIERPDGLLVVTGPSGSGKTTTLLMLLSETAKQQNRNVISLEEPVEVLLPGVNQMRINPSIGLTFSSAGRSILRQDPDVICIGEVRDPETALLIAKIVQTGHLALTQLHAGDCVSALRLLKDLGVPAYLLNGMNMMIIAQRLVRKLCDKCKKSLSANERQELPEYLKNSEATFYKPVGCKQCNNIGFKGRIPLHEFLEPDNALKSLLSRNAAADEMRKSLPDKHRFLLDDGITAVMNGVTTLSEVIYETGALSQTADRS